MVLPTATSDLQGTLKLLTLQTPLAGEAAEEDPEANVERMEITSTLQDCRVVLKIMAPS